MKSTVSLFIPVYNAAKLIRKNLREGYNALLKLNDSFEIVIVDDNSTDKSYRFKKILEKARKTTGKELLYVSYTKGPSRRENLGWSFLSAKHDIIGFIDADFACDISYVTKAVELLIAEHADIVIGNRYMKASVTKRNRVRLVLSICYNFRLVSRIYGLIEARVNCRAHGTRRFQGYGSCETRRIFSW